MPNLLKYNSVVIKEDDKLVIDSNKIIQELLAERNSGKSVINYGKQAAKPDDDGFVCGIDAAKVEQLISEEPSPEEKATASDFIRQAEEDARQIIENARNEADAVYNAAREKGYNEGIEQSRKYIEDVIKQKQEEADNKYNRLSKKLEDEYNQKMAKMEPELVDIIVDVFSKAVFTISEGQKSIITSLIERAVSGMDAVKNFLVRVSSEDYKYVCDNKGRLTENVPPETSVEIIKDSVLKKNQCIIETEAGVIDCSLDIQLENLIEEIKLISRIN